MELNRFSSEIFFLAKEMRLVGEEAQLKKPLAGEIQVVVMNGIDLVVTLEMNVVAVTFEIDVVKREKGECHHLPEQIGKKVGLLFA